MILNDETYVHARRYENDINIVCERYPDGAPDHVIAACLQIEEGQVEPAYEAVVVKLRGLMGVDND